MAKGFPDGGVAESKGLGGAVVAPAPQPPRDPALSIARVIEIVHEHIRRGSEDNAASWREGGNNAVD